MLDPRIRVLQAVERHGTVTAAAAALAYSPSAVSYQLRQLSEQLGCPLIRSSGRRSSLTPQARIILRHAEQMQAQWEVALGELATAGDEPSGIFTVCGFSTAATRLLPRPVAVMGSEFPLLDVRVIQADPVDCFELVSNGDADLALVMVTPDTPPLSDHRFEQQHLADDPLDLVVPVGHPLLRRDRVTLSDAAEERWIVSSTDSAYHDLTVGACVSAGFSPDLVHRVEEWETGAALVEQGLGVTLVPRLGWISPEWDVVRIGLVGDPQPVRRIATVIRRGASAQPAVTRLLELVGERCRELYPGTSGIASNS